MNKGKPNPASSSRNEFVARRGSPANHPVPVPAAQLLTQPSRPIESKRIWIGNQTACAASHFLEPFEFALASGFDAFEWFPDKKSWGAGWDETDLTSELSADIRASARISGVRLSVHAPWTANPLETEAAPIIQRHIEMARALGASLLNVHLQVEAGIPAYARAIVPLIRQAASAGMILAIENTPATTPEHFNELFSLLPAAGSKSPFSAGMCLDLGHANLCATTRNDYLAYLERLGPHIPIVHLHLHENWGDSDSHLPLFTGPSAVNSSGVELFLKRIQARGFAGSMILEQWPEPPQLLTQARNRVLQLLSPVSVPA